MVRDFILPINGSDAIDIDVHQFFLCQFNCQEHYANQTPDRLLVSQKSVYLLSIVLLWEDIYGRKVLSA
jgi:hypothetical protein